MASEKVMRESDSGERDEIHVQKDIVPKITSHFESLAEKVRGSDIPGGVTDSSEDHHPQKKEQQYEAEKQRGVGKLEVHAEEEEQKGGSSEQERRTNMAGKQGEETGKEREKKQIRDRKEEDISNYRQIAQQNSMQAIRAAEERYNNKKEKDTAVQGVPKISQYAVEKGSAVKDTVLEKADKGKDSTAQTAEQAKDYASQKAAEAKEVTVDTAKKVGSYAGEKAAAVKDAAVETGKSAAGYAGKVAVDVKDKAAVAGWGAAHYTCEKTVEATLAATNVAQGVAGYTGDKVVAAKDVMAHAGQRAVEYTGEKVAAAKDAVVATEESAKEYTARKKAEAERELQARKSTQSKGESGGQEDSTSVEEAKSMAKEVIKKPAETVQEFSFQGAPEQDRREQQQQGSRALPPLHETRDNKQGGRNGGGVLQAVGETIVEIAQTTKDLVIGHGEDNQTGGGEHKGRYDGSRLDHREQGQKKQQQ
ncbi:Seed biotin-containing protein SBP65 [Camellia lanceoleosa]|uniref:Seed biotin-containing protein SBP65 n=1 Tax=Camellia lanceoleosa TaxID=1840588 RepID=A0ACC0HAX8_9ERIC|nr:Seed biotin-containing protein SBP65 [Camellia lanceoleosa]